MWGELISGGLSLLGGMSASASSAKGIEAMNAANSAEAQRNRDWMQMMSSTAHQREVDDLRAAGLNPILSATGGSGASSPGGSMAVHEDEQIRSTSIKAQLANLAANTAKTIAESRLTEAKTENEKGTINALGMRGPLSGLKKWANNLARKYDNPRSSANIRSRILSNSHNHGASGSW
ncbi:MAG: DNA pilot protein [Arizlama microvirus]|nr:MAG: DNA pilot protein [Arizlama microvirus]